MATKTDFSLSVFWASADGCDIPQRQQSAVLGHNYGQVGKGKFASALILESQLQGGLSPADDTDRQITGGSRDLSADLLKSQAEFTQGARRDLDRNFFFGQPINPDMGDALLEQFPFKLVDQCAQPARVVGSADQKARDKLMINDS